MKYYSVYITTKDKDEARKIGNNLIELRLAACVNLIDSVESIYHWQGKIQNTNETILVAKTKESALKKLIERVKSLHSYENPCIVVWPIVDGNKDYFEWINNETIDN